LDFKPGGQTEVIDRDVEVLRPTAATIIGTWSIPGWTIAAESKDVQTLAAQGSAFGLIEGGNDRAQ